MFLRIIFLFVFVISLVHSEAVYLKTPTFSRDEIIGTTVGIRPFRKSGVRIEAEKIKDKLIVHNYGYGGSGLTLSFGGSKQVLEILEEQNILPQPIAVLGSGVIGLATAYDLLEKGYQVHLYSDNWSPNLTSNVAAGIWTPLNYPADLPIEKKNHHQLLQDLAESRFLKSTGSHPEFSGVKMMNYYAVKSETDQKPSQGKEVDLHFDNGMIKKGLQTYRIAIDGQLFMEDLFSKVKNGAQLHQKHFENLDEILNLKEEVIINCLSLGSRELFNDQDFIPARGQMLYFKPQEIDYFLFQRTSEPHYFFFIYPWSDRLILGGIQEICEEEPVIVPEVIEKLFQNAERLIEQQ